MYVDIGTVKPGKTVFVPFHTFDSNDPSASVTITGLATTDIEVYKDASMTQRASDSGYALVDTDGIDIDTTTGIHGVTIDLSDNTTAGFWAAGSDYVVVIASITVDAATVNFIPIRFRIGYEQAILNTTIATLASQTNFTLTSGPAEDDALNGMWCVIHDVASEAQMGYAVISDYTGSTKTVTLAAGTTFTAAATDNIAIMGPMPLQPTTSGNSLDVTATGAAGIDWGNVENQSTSVNLSATTTNLVNTTTTNTDMRGTDSAYTGTPPTAAAISDAVWDEAQADHVAAGSFGVIATEIAGIQTDLDNGTDGLGAIKTAVDAIPTSNPTAAAIADQVWDEATSGHVTAGTFGKALSDILVDTAEIGTAGAGLTNINLPDQTMNITGNITGNLSGSVGSVTGNVDGSVASVATGGITAASIAADAIGASELAADAVTEIVTGVLTTQMTESYATDGTAPTVAQALFQIQQFLQEPTYSGTTLTIKKLDGSTTAMTFTLDDGTNPTSHTRAT